MDFASWEGLHLQAVEHGQLFVVQVDKRHSLINYLVNSDFYFELGIATDFSAEHQRESQISFQLLTFELAVDRHTVFDSKTGSYLEDCSDSTVSLWDAADNRTSSNWDIHNFDSLVDNIVLDIGRDSLLCTGCIGLKNMSCYSSCCIDWMLVVDSHSCCSGSNFVVEDSSAVIWQACYNYFGSWMIHLRFSGLL